MMQLPALEQNIFETILARRSVRNYSPQPVPILVLNTVLEAAVWAPSAMHKQPWGFVIVQNKQILQSISESAKALLRLQGKRNQSCAVMLNQIKGNLFFDAPTLIIVCGRTYHQSYEAECWMAAENLMLAACAMQLGTCVVSNALPAISRAETKLILGIPDNYSAVSPIVIGYPNAKTAPCSRKSPLILNTLV